MEAELQAHISLHRRHDMTPSVDAVFLQLEGAISGRSAGPVEDSNHWNGA